MKEILFLIIVLFSNIIQTVSGFAGTMLAMPLSVRLIGYDDSRYILNFIGIVVSLYILLSKKKLIKLNEVVKIISFMFLGIIISKILLINIKLDFLLVGYGMLIIAVAIYQLLGKKIHLNKIGDIIVLVFSGIIHGLFISGGAILVIYAINKFKEKDCFRANLSLVWLILNGFLHFNMIYEGQKADFLLSIFAISITIIAMFIGNKISNKIDQNKFVWIANILLFISGVSILV